MANPQPRSVWRTAIGLGSNTGDRLRHLRFAAAELRGLAAGEGAFLQSRVYETAPVDCPDGSGAFLNAAVEFSCDLAPETLLDRMLAIEIRAGRPAGHGVNTPRTLDLDILYMGNLRLRTERLCVPHAAAAGRLFVLAPLADIAPDFTPPGWKATIAECRREAAARQIETIAVTEFVLW